MDAAVKDSRRSIGAAIAISLMVAVVGCSAPSQGLHQFAWSCDPRADAAVHKEQWQKALELHRQFLETEPGNCLAIYHVGYILGKLNHRQQEVSAYERAVACGYTNDDQLFFNLGMALGDLSEPERAIAALEQAIQINPRNAENHFGLGYIAQMTGRGTLAVTALERAVELSAEHTDARVLLARIYLDQGRLAEARAHLEAVQKNDPENPEVHMLWNIYRDRVTTSYD
jgi:tetratricopeptide (TPR) repeat protein